MLKSALFFCVCLMLSPSAFGQSKDSVKSACKKIRICTVNRAHALANPPLYIIKVSSKPGKEAIADSLFIKRLNPKWVENLYVYKDKEQTVKYGTKAKKGVVVIGVKADSFKNNRIKTP